MAYSLHPTTTDIFLENMTKMSERKKLYSITEEAAVHIDNEMVSKLYDSALNKKHVNFGKIPDSKGKIVDFEGYKSMIEVIGIIRSLSKNSPELETLQTAIDNIVGLSQQFELGFKLKKEFVIMTYNSLVMSCVVGTSELISAYVDFVKSPDAVELTFNTSKNSPSSVIFKNLANFNTSVKKGEFVKIINTVNKGDKESFTGAGALLPLAIIGGLLAIVPIIRELIFYFYASRMKLSDYLKLQSEFLEFNKIAVENNKSMTVDKRKKIIKKQAKVADNLRKMSDKIRVDSQSAERHAIVEIKKENKNYTLGNMNPTKEVPVVKDEPYSLENDPDIIDIL